MRTLLLSSLSILGGLTTVHAQHWVPYSFHTYKQSPKQTEQAPAAAEKPADSQAPVAAQAEEATDGIASNAELDTFFSLDSQTAYNDLSIFYLDPDRDFRKPKAAAQSDELASSAELETLFSLDSEIAYNEPSLFYSDPDRDYGKPKPLHPPEKLPRRWRLCTENWWVEGDYMLVWLKKGHINAPLITTGAATDASPGVIGQPGTSVVFGRENYNFKRTSGVRGSIGGYFGMERQYAFDIDGFYVFTRSKSTHVNSDASGSPIIARPFFDMRTGFENAELVSDPGFYSGSSTGTVKTGFWGLEANIGYHPCSNPINSCHPKPAPKKEPPCANMMTGDFFIGARYLHLFEKISVKDEITPIATPSGLSFNGAANLVNPPDMLRDQDVFRANNDFWGGQLGIRGDFAWNAWFSMGFMGKVAFGVTEQRYKTEGETIWSSTAFGRQYASSGVLVQPNNQVHKTRWKFGWVPEINFNIGIEPFEHMRFTVGYTILWWNKVVRAGAQIDRDVNSGQIPRDPSFYTPAIQTPSDHLKEHGFWMQSVNFGVCFDF